MEERVPNSNNEEKGWNLKELKKVSCMAAPMVVVSMAQYLVLSVSLIMAGHLGDVQLSGVSIATSFTNATGLAVTMGLSGALETLCGQAYGASQFQKFGSYTYCAITSMIPICIPIAILWGFLGKILLAVGIDPDISSISGKYSIFLIPALFSYGILQSLIRYFQTQSLIFPLFITSCVTLAIHIPLCWTLIYKLDFGYIGGAISVCISCWFNTILLAFYMRFSSSSKKTRTVCWKEIILSVREFWRFAIPSAVMLCLEAWTFEALILLSGILPNPKLETSLVTICITTATLHYFLQYGLAAAASTRVANELGSGNPKAAQSVVRVVLVVSTTEAIIVSATIFFCRRFFGYAYSNNKEVASYFAEVAPFFCISFIMDSLQAIFSGIVRGSGRQRVGALTNLLAYYFVGMPLSVVLCFVVDLRGKGLWIGVLVGSTVQAIVLGVVIAMTNWEKQVNMAHERLFRKQFTQVMDDV